MLEVLIDSIFAMFGGRVFQPWVGIPMGTNCSLLLVDLFIYSYEADSIQGLLKKNEKNLAQSFNYIFRYINDVHSLNNSSLGDFVDRTCPIDLEIKHTQIEIGQERNLTTTQMISIFPLSNFNLYVATFQQHLHMVYTFLSWYDIQELVVPIRISLM